MTASRPENSTDEVQEDNVGEPLEASADKAEPGLTPDEAQDGEAKENLSLIHI